MISLTRKATAVFASLLLFASFSAGAEVRFSFLKGTKCIATFSEYGQSSKCERETSSSERVTVLMSEVTPDKFSSICAESEKGVRLFCFLIRPKVKNLFGTSPVGIKDTSGNPTYVYPVPYASEPFPKNFILKYNPGAVLVELFAETDLKGRSLGVFEIKDGGSVSIGSPANSAKSATILGLGKYQQLCIRSVKNIKHRCYQGDWKLADNDLKESGLTASGLAGTDVNDLNATEAPRGFKLEHEGRFENDIYSIGLTPMD